ncbi:MAG: RluA family pseudouridine synthase [Oscillospiraceae bacterium]|nr:RluA family pseudouridine synthase [Oscillospiraceae bacterium]
MAPHEDGQQVKQILRSRGVSVRLMNQLKRTPNGLTINGEKVVRTVDLCAAGDTLVLNIPADEQPLEGLAYDLDILYEDGDIVVVNKPPTLPMHPSRAHQGNTLANAIAARYGVTFRAAGRLDKGTSGIVVVCLHAFAAAKLNSKVSKTYTALVHGEYHGAGTFSNTIYRPNAMSTIRACRDYSDAREPGDETAVTHWQAQKTDDRGRSSLQIKLETGRTHQIRVHFAHHSTPLLGDDYYGAPAWDKPGHALHCGEARFVHPVTGEEMTFTCDPPWVDIHSET